MTCLLFASVSEASTLTFNVSGTSASPASWTTQNNWLTTTVPVAGDSVYFNQTNGAVNYIDGTGGVAGIINFSPSNSYGYVIQSGTITLNNGSSNAQINQLSTDKANNSITSALQLAGNGNLDITNNKNAALNITGTIYGMSGVANTITVKNSAGGTVNMGSISDNSGAIAMTLDLDAGTGAINLSGTGSLFSGSVIVRQGVVALSAGQALGASGTATVNSGGTVSLNGKSGVTKNFILNGSGSGTATTNSGALVNTTGNASATGTVQLASDSTIAIASGASLTLSGTISGSGKLTLTGSGTLTLGNTASSYTGGTEIGKGTLVATKNNSLGTGNITVDSGAILTLSSSSTLNAIGDTAGLIFSSTSTINLNFTGTDTIGFLKLSDSSLYIGTGTYTASELNSFFDVSAFSGTGSLVVTIVPEPSAYALLFFGLTILVIQVRRRSSRSVAASLTV